MLECGHKEVRGDKNYKSISKIEKLMKQFLPNVVLLQDLNAKGSTYAYKGVEQHEFENLKTAPSVGSYLNRNFKNVYPYERA